MRLADMLKFALVALYQQKVRTLLTTFGVVCATFVLAMSVSVGVGVQDLVTRQFRRHDRLRRIEIWPTYKAPNDSMPPGEQVIQGKMSEAKRERIRQAKINDWGRRHAAGPRVALTPERLQDLRTKSHVESVVPFIQQRGRASIGDRNEEVNCLAAPLGDWGYSDRIVAGRFFVPSDDHAVVVSEYLLYRLGIADDGAVEQALGKMQIRLEFRSGGRSASLLLMALNAGRSNLAGPEEKVLHKVMDRLTTILSTPDAIAPLGVTENEREILDRLIKGPSAQEQPNPEIVISEDFTVVGILRPPTREEAASSLWPWMAADEDVVLPLGTAEGLFAQLSFLDLPVLIAGTVGLIPSPLGQGPLVASSALFPGRTRDNGYWRATVTVDREDNVKEVTQQIASSGLGYFSLADILERVRLNVLLISFATAFVATVALLVAALGIINTMLMAVLERTHEIGVMKAVGARDGHIQLIFLIEGTVIGLVGGGLGLLCSWIASFPGNAVAQSLMEKQTQTRLEVSLFVFPLWLTLGIPLFAGLVTTVAAVLPARRAARISPVAALRHE